MKASREWISEMTHITASDKEYADRMTMSGSKVEGYEMTGSEINCVIVGRILEFAPHGDSDHLLVCKVDVGQGSPLTIVTGAHNISVGDLVPVALDGASLPGGKQIVNSEIRGVPSQGMLCSLTELGLDNHDFPYAANTGIFVLREECVVGDDIKDVLGLGDCVVDFEITPNRPDCLSIRGLARESAVTFGTKLMLEEPVISTSSQEKVEDYLQVEVADPDLCPRYTAGIVTDIKIGPSPRWMRRRLRACGVRPINNIVDITNYVMLEYGQPMHAFDYACVTDGKIIVRRSAPGEELTTLDGVTRTLKEDMLLITDVTGPIGIAGVMGGENSEITESTKAIVFESACFDGPSIRKTAISLGMRTDASGRYEKGLDPNNTELALKRACELVGLLGAGTVVCGTIDICAEISEPVSMKLDAESINVLLGTDIGYDFMEKTLKDLGFSVKNGYVTVPSWRSDVEIMADIAEEIARFYGYDNIIPTMKNSSEVRGGLSKKQRFESEINYICRSLGFSEILTYSFTSPSDWDKIQLPAESPLRRAFVIQNPLGEDTSVMRTTTLSSMLNALALNLNHRNMEAMLFELAKIYLPVDGETLADERPVLTMGAYGDDIDFFTFKGCIETLLRTLRVRAQFEAVTDNPSYHPGRCAGISINNVNCGVFGQIHPSATEAFGISREVYAAQIDLRSLMESVPSETTFTPLPRFPAMNRDLALICDAGVTAASLENVIRLAGGTYLEDVSLFDVYTGASIPEGKKSLAYALTLRSWDKTLTDEDADKTIASILDALKNQLDVTLR